MYVRKNVTFSRLETILPDVPERSRNTIPRRGGKHFP